MKGTNLFLKIAKRPVESIVFIISIGLLVYAFYLLSPAYMPNYASPLSALSTRLTEYLLGLAWFGASMPGVLSVFVTKKRKLLQWATFLMFLSYFFLFILRIIVIGFVPLSWVPLLVLSLICGVLRLYLWVQPKE